MKAHFRKHLVSDGMCVLSMQTKQDRETNAFGKLLVPEGTSIAEAELTPLVLHALAEAYAIGYNEALSEAHQSVDRLMLDAEIRKPSLKIETVE